MRLRPDIRRNSERKRRKREQAAPGTFTQQQWEAMQTFYGYRCVRCKGTGLDLYPDHIIPLARGGSHDASNRQPLCRVCNSIKGTKTIDYRPGFIRGSEDQSNAS